MEFSMNDVIKPTQKRKQMKPFTQYNGVLNYFVL